MLDLCLGPMRLKSENLPCDLIHQHKATVPPWSPLCEGDCYSIWTVHVAAKPCFSASTTEPLRASCSFWQLAEGNREQGVCNQRPAAGGKIPASGAPFAQPWVSPKALQQVVSLSDCRCITVSIDLVLFLRDPAMVASAQKFCP